MYSVSDTEVIHVTLRVTAMLHRLASYFLTQGILLLLLPSSQNTGVYHFTWLYAHLSTYWVRLANYSLLGKSGLFPVFVNLCWDVAIRVLSQAEFTLP